MLIDYIYFAYLAVINEGMYNRIYTSFFPKKIKLVYKTCLETNR